MDTQFNNEEDLNLREELLVLSAKKEIKYKENYIKKASEKTLERIYEEYKKAQLMETNEMLTDLVIGKFAEVLENLGWIDSAAETGRGLQEKKLFRQDVNSLVSKISPFIPFVGILEGGICVAEDVAKKTVKTDVKTEEVEKNVKTVKTVKTVKNVKTVKTPERSEPKASEAE